MTGKRIKNTKELAISDYLLQCDIPITFNDFDILAFDSNKFKLLIKESLLMKCVQSALNTTTKSFGLFDKVFMFSFYKKFGRFSIFNRNGKNIYEL